MLRSAAAALAFGVGACATTPNAGPDAFAARSAANSFEAFGGAVDPPSTLLLPLVHDRQINAVACGAHVLASLTNYWLGADHVSGAQIFSDRPPTDMTSGYSMAEMLTLAGEQGLLASAVRLQPAGLVRELEAGRPVLVPVRVPSVFVQGWQLPGANLPVLGIPAALVMSRSAQVAELTGQGMLNHYVLIAGYDGETFVILEPVMGLRTISAARLSRYREAFGDAAIVLSPPPGAV
ncbi:hypothetical protein [Hyphomonas sp.]|uniref:hypothetical protein n=1 Tax=Hyphomonas sp. TaxID=87 RepID=UPI00391BDBBC